LSRVFQERGRHSPYHSPTPLTKRRSRRNNRDMADAQKVVLVVEDEVSAQGLYKSMLTDEKYTVQTASDVQQAYQLVNALKPNLNLLDIMLPGGKNAFDFLRQIRQDEHTKDIPVIVFTNLDTEKDTALDLGAQD